MDGVGAKLKVGDAKVSLSSMMSDRCCWVVTDVRYLVRGLSQEHDKDAFLHEITIPMTTIVRE